ncbi:sugar phosphate isomerase/epimerase [Akkermansiaceae bacterium]|jgi:sugar phosphate isomerase/epimerase|nr:sugar phosphate isomerase/epimerase [Akkermansiaceae bacterium]
MIAGLGTIGLCGARGPIARNGNANLRLGLAAYSFRDHFAWMKGKAREAQNPMMNMMAFIDYCAEHQVAGAELTSYFFPGDADEAYFRKIRHHAHVSGVSVCGTAIGNNFSRGRGDHLDLEIAAAKKWIDRAVWMGAPHVRFFAGTARDFAKAPDRMAVAIEALQECCDYAGKRGVFVGVENHGNLTSGQVLEIVKGVDSKWFGVNLDTGNFHSADPYADLEKCAPYAVNVQLKMAMKTADGNSFDTDLTRVSNILKKARHQGFVVLEYEGHGAGRIPATDPGFVKWLLAQKND